MSNQNPTEITEEQISLFLFQQIKAHPIAKNATSAWASIGTTRPIVSVSAMSDDFTIYNGRGDTFAQAAEDCRHQLEVAPRVRELQDEIARLKAGKTEKEAA
jgi:hypothetical protein